MQHNAHDEKTTAANPFFHCTNKLLMYFPAVNQCQVLSSRRLDTLDMNILSSKEYC